jgi:Tetracyclin repressor-like, C-terminal domain
VAAFAEAVAATRPALAADALHKPLAMLLFGMINWMFTWFRPGQPLTHEQMAPLVADLFTGGLAAVLPPQASTGPPVPKKAPRAAARKASLPLA